MTAPGADLGQLTGLRVLEVATLYAAPQVEGNSLWWSVNGRNKRSIVLELGDEHADDRAVFRRLVAASDVLVENLPAETRTRWGCTYDDLAALNPSLVVVSVSLVSVSSAAARAASTECQRWIVGAVLRP